MEVPSPVCENGLVGVIFERGIDSLSTIMYPLGDVKALKFTNRYAGREAGSGKGSIYHCSKVINHHMR